jgi:hypothetical protein
MYSIYGPTYTSFYIMGSRHVFSCVICEILEWWYTVHTFQGLLRKGVIGRNAQMNRTCGCYNVNFFSNILVRCCSFCVLFTSNTLKIQTHVWMCGKFGRLTEGWTSCPELRPFVTILGNRRAQWAITFHAYKFTSGLPPSRLSYEVGPRGQWKRR